MSKLSELHIVAQDILNQLQLLSQDEVTIVMEHVLDVRGLMSAELADSETQWELDLSNCPPNPNLKRRVTPDTFVDLMEWANNAPTTDQYAFDNWISKMPVPPVMPQDAQPDTDEDVPAPTTAQQLIVTLNTMDSDLPVPITATDEHIRLLWRDAWAEFIQQRMPISEYVEERYPMYSPAEKQAKASYVGERILTATALHDADITVRRVSVS